MAIEHIKNYFKVDVRLYKDCSDLPIYNFDMVYRTQDFKYLVFGYDGYKDVKVPKEVEQRWKDIFDEWVKACDDSTITYYYQLILEVAYLESRFHLSNMLLYQIYTRYPQTMSEKSLDIYIEALAKFKYHYNKKNDMLDEISRLLDQHKASENKLGLKKSELEALRGDDNIEDIQSLEKQAVVLEQITGKNNIDIFTTSVLKWLEIGKLATRINQQRSKHGK